MPNLRKSGADHTVEGRLLNECLDPGSLSVYMVKHGRVSVVELVFLHVFMALGRFEYLRRLVRSNVRRTNGDAIRCRFTVISNA